MNQITYSHHRFRYNGTFISSEKVVLLFHEKYLFEKTNSFTELMKLAKFNVEALLPCLSDCIYYPLPLLQTWIAENKPCLILEINEIVEVLNQLVIQLSQSPFLSKYRMYVSWSNEFKKLLLLYQSMTYWFQHHSKKQENIIIVIDNIIQKICNILLRYH
jgi:hypothetical protein